MGKSGRVGIAYLFDKKKGITLRNSLIINVGATRFELATTRPPDVYSTGLSYAPKQLFGLSGWFLWQSIGKKAE